MRNRILVCTLLGLMAVCIGCTDDTGNPLQPDAGGDIPDSDLPFPATPDLLMSNFVTIYQTMNAAEYKLILDPAFETHLTTITMNAFPDLGATLDDGEENRIHGRLFSGKDLTDAGGVVLPAIHGFSFSKIEKIVDWGESLSSDTIPNTLSALYELEILVDRGPSHSTLKVEGQVRFYAKPSSGRVDGQSQTYFRLVGQFDLTKPFKATESIAWGSLKALYF